MARGKTLDTLVADVRAETGYNTSTSTGVGSLAAIQQAVKFAQEELYDEYDWPFLRCRRDKTLNAGQRYYDWPADLNYDRITSMSVLFSGIWTPVEHGISMDDYSVFDSDNDERTDPVRKIDIIDIGSGEQFEVWPLPATAGTIRFEGYKALTNLVSGNDTAVLDDILIVKRAATNIVYPKDNDLGRQKNFEFERRMTTLRKNSVIPNARPVVPGGAGTARRDPRFRTLVVARSSS